jgi:hypothetical protein
LPPDNSRYLTTLSSTDFQRTVQDLKPSCL